MENEQMLEQKKLDEFLQVINENLKELREKKKEVDQENKELYDAYMEGDVELYSSLMVSSTMQDHVNHSITANESALEKTHFGRIDYLDQEKGETVSPLYWKARNYKKCNRYCNYGLESSGRFDLL